MYEKEKSSTKESMKATTLSSGTDLLDYIEGMTPLPDLILLDIVMPGMNGIETLKTLKAKEDGAAGIPVVYLTGEDDLQLEAEGLKVGAQDFIRKPFVPEILTLRVKRILEYARYRNDLTKEVDKKTKEINRLSLHIVQTLAEAIDAKDTYTNGHSGRVATYSREMAKRLGYDEHGQDEVYIMGLLHDVGKIGVPDQIINKPDRLTDEEFAEIKKHPGVGDRILKKISEIPKLAYGARWHHERIDGRGYPDGLKGNMIPEEARIIAVADAYDAMTSNRSYRDVLPQEVVRGELEKGKGSQFDERIADIMIHMIDEDKDYCMREGAAEKYGLRERSEEETAAHMDEQPVLPEKLSMLKGIDTELGLFMCGDIEDYLDALSIFACSITSKAAKIEGALSENDIATYTTLVHSLKSSARTVGAAGVSDVAKRLETAGKQLDIDRIREETRELLASYRELETPLKEILEM
ncbi:MAG: HD domain-containing protein [Lachnospiraceae bacterium]|nr:HD domain-containing protein [Lachnospiraceae bacterium]